MSAQSHLFGAAGRTDDDQTLAELEVDYTPVAVPVQFFLAVAEFVLPAAPTVLCPGAGSGSWARAVRALWPHATILGIEPRVSERANLQAVCDAVFTGTFEAFVATLPTPHGLSFDIIADNTPFSAFKTFWPGLILDSGLLARDGLLAMYGLTQWGQSEKAIPHLRRWSPSYQFRVGGRIEHRGHGTQSLRPIPKKLQTPGGPTHELRDNGGDAREYCTWVWDRVSRCGPVFGGLNVRRPRWFTEQLPELPTEMRRWSPSAVPGTYPIEPALVDEIRRRYL